MNSFPSQRDRIGFHEMPLIGLYTVGFGNQPNNNLSTFED